MPGSWRIEVDRGSCRGTGICTVTAPGRFTVDGGLRAGPVDPVIEPDDTVLDAVDSCPLGAISVLDTATGRVVASPDVTG
ncbi:ferredoxin [Actinoplanes sp. RD1]|uniref:ferredoxin n=1 Tax=Actinoplanes sp. RD1 TaxID=3064538 RepID=UPI002740E73A|nr:ferredoxin [Actinoplanes sp. RD1]